MTLAGYWIAFLELGIRLNVLKMGNISGFFFNAVENISHDSSGFVLALQVSPASPRRPLEIGGI